MKNYWSCTPFADWLRGSAKLKCGTADEWDDWHTAAKMKHNFRYWLAEEGLDHIQKFIYWPLDKIYAAKYYVNNRWISRTHSLTAHSSDITPGNWCDVGNRILPCLFNELVDFVEVELAWWHLVWEGKEERKKYNAPWWRFGWWNMRLWRCPQAGLDNLKWQASLTLGEDMGVKEGDKDYGKPTRQAVNAQEILDLYTWWTQVYRNRPDPMDASGWSAYCEEKRQLRGKDGRAISFFSDRGVTKEMKARGNKALKLTHKIEAQYEKEDTEMMIRLIKIRNSLWT